MGIFVEHEHLDILGATLTYVLETFAPLPKTPTVRSPEFTINIVLPNTAYARLFKG